MATVFLMCGLPGSGKTTLARQIERERHAIRLAPDEWIAALFGPDIQQRDPLTFHGPARDRTEVLQRELAGRLLSLGLDVILENGFWGRSERDEYRAWARALGARVALRHLGLARGAVEAAGTQKREPRAGDIPGRATRTRRVVR